MIMMMIPKIPPPAMPLMPSPPPPVENPPLPRRSSTLELLLPPLPFHTNTSNILFFASLALVLPTGPDILLQSKIDFIHTLIIYYWLII